jgi:hypothetical protein
MKILILALAATFMTGTANAADIAPSYAVPGYAGRINPVVTLCPSADGSKTAVACGTSGAPSVVTVTGALPTGTNALGSVTVTGTPTVAATSTPATTTFEGTMTLAAATSTSLIAANVTMAPNSAALPATFTTLTVSNTGTTPAFVCWFGGAASATSGCETLAAGASDAVSLAHFATPPTFFSTAGTTLAFRS